MSISELRYLHSPETRFRGFLTTLKRRLGAGSNFFALGPPKYWGPCWGPIFLLRAEEVPRGALSIDRYSTKDQSAPILAQL